MTFRVNFGSAMGDCHLGGPNPKRYEQRPSLHHLRSHNGHCKESSISHRSGNRKGSHGKSKKVTFASHSSTNISEDVGSMREVYGPQCNPENLTNWSNHGLTSINGKKTMQDLNGRLSTYLEKVQLMEKENTKLEKQICEWYANNGPRSLPDASRDFLITIQLQNQVSEAAMENARFVLQADTAWFDAGELRIKIEMEISLKKDMEADTDSIRRVLQQLHHDRKELEKQLQSLNDELSYLKQSHDQEVKSRHGQLGVRVNVELKAAPSVDLNHALSAFRKEYGALMEKNLDELHVIFLKKAAEQDRNVIAGPAQLQLFNNEISAVKLCVQALEIEKQSEMDMDSVLKGTLTETEATYASTLSQFQHLIDGQEAQIEQLRSDLEKRNKVLRLLSGEKTHIEKEISTYGQLLKELGA